MNFIDQQGNNFFSKGSTVWKFHDFSITQILREINYGDYRSANSAVLTHLGALIFDFNAFLQFLKGEIYQIS